MYVDGIPATMPDGQGQSSNIDLNSLDHIEVLTGPFSSLYGNSSGGTILAESKEGQGKDTKSSSLERNELLRTIKRLGRTLWKKWSGYHRRSLVETKMHCIKLLGDKLSARSFDSQVNEIHARVAVLNRFTELGRPLTQVTP
jgi:hypothetical protein